MPTVLKGTTRYRPTSTRRYLHPSDTNAPELPWLCPDTDYFVPVGGALWDCPDTASLLTAIAGATGGDRIQVHPGVRYTLNNVTLPAHGGSRWVYVFVASKLSGTFPLSSSVYHIGGTQTQGQRVDVQHSYATLGASSPLAQFELAVGVTGNSILCTPQSSGGGWWFEGIEFMLNESSTGTANLALIALGADSANNFPSSLANMPSYYNFGHCIVRGKAGVNNLRGILTNAAYVGIRDSSIYEIHTAGQDSQAVMSWGSPGVQSVINCFLSSGGETILHGGAPPGVAGLVQRNFTVKWNHFWKNPAWFTVNGGPGWATKNHYEHKHGTHALVEDCVLENNSSDGQDGTNILFQTLEDFAVNPPAYKLTDITMRKLYVFGGGALAAINGATDTWGGAVTTFTEQPTSRILLSNILCEQIAGTRPESARAGDPTAVSEYILELTTSARDLFFENITAEGKTQNSLFIGTPYFDADAVTRFTMRNNVMGRGVYDTFWNSDTAHVANTALAEAIKGGWAIDRNVFYASVAGDTDNPANNPTNNSYPTSAADVGFSSYTLGTPGGLAAASAYKGYGTDGADPGADTAYIASMKSAVRSTNLPT